MSNTIEDAIKSLVWGGTLNVEIRLHKSVTIQGTTERDASCHIVIQRESYLVLYLPFILDKFKRVLKLDVSEGLNGWWFEMEGTPVHWNHPVGSLYDSFKLVNPNSRTKRLNFALLEMWKLTLNYGDTLPTGLLPLIEGFSQVEDYWRHQWKQACFIMNGTSKQIMSLSIRDLKLFWGCVLNRDGKSFYDTANKIIPKNNSMRQIPIRVHLASINGIKIIQPSVFVIDNSNFTLGKLLKKELTELFIDKAVPVKPFIQGIEIPLDSQLVDLYPNFFSIDGFLNVSISEVKT